MAQRKKNSNDPQRPPKPLRKRPDVRTQPPDIRDRCMKLGQVCKALEDKKIANGGTLPHGSRPQAIEELRELGMVIKPARFEELWEDQYLPSE